MSVPYYPGRMRKSFLLSLLALLSLTLVPACGDDEGTEADQIGVGRECTTTPECPDVSLGDAGIQQLQCLTDFKGGYCGLVNCNNSSECPDGSICVLHTDAQTYCFRTCLDKAECNLHRSVDNEANCSSSFDWANAADDDGSKACIPPSSGI